jgi:DNA-binding transcriptional MerR regulator
MDDALLPIGQFSTLSRLSPKALRLYDELGLVEPARTDPITGYRWYEPGQAPRARMVGLLRGLHMPLPRIAAVLDLPAEDAVQAVREHVAADSAAAQGRAELARYVCLLLNGSPGRDVMDDELKVETRTVAERTVLSWTRRVHADGLGEALGEALGRMRSAGPGLPGIEGCPYLVYYAEVSEDSDGPVEVVRPTAAWADAEAAAARFGDVQARVEGEHDEAFVRLTMGQTRGSGALQAVDVLRRAVEASGREPLGPPRQVMIADWRTAAADAPASDLAVPLRRAGAGRSGLPKVTAPRRG